MSKSKIGFIGQGFVGKNMADDFVERGFEVVRYSLEPEYIINKDLIKTCDVVFIAVPTPSTPEGFDDSILRKEVKLVGEGKLLVIKSTVVPGTTESIQKENPNIFVLHSPEFLVAANAKEDTKNPERNLVGLPFETPEHREKAELVLSILPKAPYNKILRSVETEIIKYIGNTFLTTKVIFMNIMYNLVDKFGADWQKVSEAVVHDSRIGKSHMNPVDNTGRGAGGHCFVKDFEAIRRFYAENVDDPVGHEVLKSLINKNNELLIKSGKDLKIVEGVHGPIDFSKKN